MSQTYRYRTIFISLLLSLLVSACQGDKNKNEAALEDKVKDSIENNSSSQKHQVAPLRTIVSAADEKIVQAAFLRDKLPESTFAYVRIPNFWSFIGTSKGNAFDTAREVKPFVDAVKSIRSGLNENVIPEIPNEEGQLIAKLLFSHLTSSIEAIAIEGVDPAIPTPNILLSASVDFTSIEEIKQILKLLAEKSPEIEIRKEIQTEGYAELNVAKLSSQFQWDQANSRIFVLLGVSLSPNNLKDVIASLVDNPNHQMKAIEKSIDSSGEGSFAWANPRKLTSVGSTLGMQKELAPLAVVGVNSMKNIALGMGTSNGINKLKYIVEMPVTGFRSYMPIISDSPKFDVVGDTKMVVSLGLPSRADFVSIENTIALVSKNKDMDGYYKFKKEFNELLGFSVEDIFDFFGQDINFVSDEAGSYAAVRLNDAEKFKQTLEKSVETLNLEYSQREIAGHTYHHLKIPSFYAKHLENKPNKTSQEKNKLMNRFLSVPSHIYWEQEGDYLILANIPQTLIDRHYFETKTPVNEWLSKQQKMDVEGSLFMASVRHKGTTKKLYRMHLGLLSYLADLVGKPIDMFALATPHEANLPIDSRYGFKLTSTQNQLAFELNYENNPYEFLLSGGAFEGIAMVGILSSIAVPAFEEYKVRTEVSSGLAAAENAKSELNEFEIEYGRYPNQYEIEDLKLNQVNKNYTLNIKPNSGEIEVKYLHRKFRTYLNRDRNTLTMLPPRQGVSTTWVCESKIQRKYLPTSCKYSPRIPPPTKSKP